MRRTTIMVDQATYADLEEYARQDGVPTARLIREAMERYVTEREQRAGESGGRVLPSFVGMLDSGSMVTGAAVEEYLEAHWTETVADHADAVAGPGQHLQAPHASGA